MAISRNPQVRRAVISNAAGSFDVIAAPTKATNRIAIQGIFFTLDADGSAVLKSNATAITGVMPFKASSGLGVRSWDLQNPLFECALGEKFAMTTVGGGAYGFVLYTIEKT